MNTKVVPNPEQKGWEADGTTPNGTPIYKWESGGGSGGSSLWEQNGNDIYYSDGNVGVGTDTPESKMNIIGDVNLGSNSDIGLDLMRVVSSSSRRHKTTDILLRQIMALEALMAIC